MRNLTILLFLGIISLDQYSCSNSTLADLPIDSSLLQLDQVVRQKSKGKARQSSRQMERAYEQQKEKHRQEVKAYHNMQKYSPFYLKHHPEARQNGDITQIQQMSQAKTNDGDELAGVESVFEKNVGKFNNLMSQSDASKQLENVQKSVKKNVKKTPKKAKKARIVSADELENDESPSELTDVE